MANIYRDFSLNFQFNKATGNLSMLNNEASINQSLKNLILMNYGDIEYLPNIAGNVRARLFDLNTSNLQDDIENDIKVVIQNYEPRVDIIKISVNESQTGNGINVTITYRAKTSSNDVDVLFYLERAI